MTLPKYCIIDLSSSTYTDYIIPQDIFYDYLGGKSLAAKLLYDLTPSGIAAQDLNSLIIINTGLMNASGAPSSARFNMTFKNMLTGGIASSNCGGDFGIMLKKSGYEGIILKGKAAVLSKIEILNGEISITPCPELAGLDTEKTQELLPKRYGKLVIGPAGEHAVKYACATSGERVAGRCGSGAVLGLKNIKAITCFGTKKMEIISRDSFSRYVKKWIKLLKAHPTTGDALPSYGTAGLVNKANASHALPTKNFTYGYYDRANDISGETLKEKFLTKNSGCSSCPIRCERRVMVDGKEVKGPEFETVGLFGSNIENFDLEFINLINYHCDLLGMDTISLAVTIAFAMELKEKGLADFSLEFGKIDNIKEIITKIAYREGIYSQLADGTAELCKIYGGEDFAIHSKGMELASYEPRRSVGMGLGYATSNRGGCHLNGGYLALLESVGAVKTDPTGIKGKPELTILFQNTMEAVSSAGFCLFTLQSMIPAFLFKTPPNSKTNRIAGSLLTASRPILALIWKTLPYSLPINSILLLPHCKAITLATGIPMTMGKFFKIGERGYNIERLYNLREGLTSIQDTLPSRLTDTPQDINDKNTVVRLHDMLPRYYHVRGWDSNGAPYDKTLKRLNIK